MSPDIPATAERSSRNASAAVVVAGIALAVFSLLAVASSLGWLPKLGTRAAGFDPDKAGAITRPPAGPPRSAVPNSVALLPGETLVTDAEAPRRAPNTEPLMPRYHEPASPRPAPPRPVEPSRTPAPPASSNRPASRESTPAPTSPRWVRSPETVAGTGIPVRPLAPRSARVEAPAGPCARCGVVTSVTSYIDQWDVHVRMDDGSRQQLRYPSPPPVTRGDRVVYENGRLALR